MVLDNRFDELKESPLDVEKLLADMTVDEKCSLTAGNDVWTTRSIDRLGIPAIRMTDGPNGARGITFDGSQSAACMPCGSALGATWDTELVREVGMLIGQETRDKSARILLAPTINLHRSPLGGRNFECYSEDPVLSGRLAGAFIHGVQSQGVAATAKHLVANDSEHERHTANSVVDERTLREVYLLPFEFAIRDGALAVMSGYNRLNGIYCGEHEWLLHDIVKGEWGFEGIIMSDWFAVGSTVGSGLAGLDLQMPGPGSYFGAPLAAAIRKGQVNEHVLEDKVRRLLTVIDRVNAWSDPLQPEGERSIGRPGHRQLARRAAVDATVLLRNNGVLPIDAHTVSRIAVIGPNANQWRAAGGGAASVTPHYRTTPLEALRARLDGKVEVVHEVGCVIDQRLPLLDQSMLVAPNGTAGMQVDVYAKDDFSGSIVDQRCVDESRLNFIGSPAPGAHTTGFSVRARSTLTPTTSGIHTFSLAQCGRARLHIDGRLLIDNFGDDSLTGGRTEGLSADATASVTLAADQPVELVMELASQPPTGGRATVENGAMMRSAAVRVGYRPPGVDNHLERAVAAAADADAAIMIVGTSDEWESEGNDRTTMDLPGQQNELIEHVLAVNPSTVVVVNTGSPVSMPWADRAPAILQTWFGGQEMANAITDVLLGEAEPGGRLPTTIPISLGHTPSYGNFPAENDESWYGEGLLVGYRWYDTRGLPTRFPFGHGLSYTTFAVGTPTMSTTQITATSVVKVSVPVSNIGSREGSEVIQCYVRACEPRLFRPAKELKAFAKVRLTPGASKQVTLELDARSFAYWDPADLNHETRVSRARQSHMGTPMVPAPQIHRRRPGWYLDAGPYELLIGRSVESIDYAITVYAAETERIE